MARSPDRRPGFSRRAQTSQFIGYVVAIAGAIVGAALLVMSRYDPPTFRALRSGAAELTVPISTALGSANGALAAVPDAIGGWFRLHGENERMRAELVTTGRLLTRARVLGHENARLRRLLALRDGATDAVVTARLVSSTAGSTRRFGLLNAGFLQGVREGQPVEGPDGLVGRVVEVGPDSARVLLLIDAESLIPVQRAGDGLPGIVAGRGDALVDIRAVNPAAGEVRPGDLFVTSGIGGIYAPGVPVTRVVRRSGDGGLGRPLAEPDTLDVAIVRHAFLPPPPPARNAVPPVLRRGKP
ncbi:rod shape-determining protein MreC [uncultured Sphingomonas sp.]|uniref:rod shape-determining protein MreC n=1 Tax=uncultured Sphingomonas sp. TaxID=158754 RepID=UPI0035C9CDDF